MEDFQILPILLLFMLTGSDKALNSETGAEEYSKYKSVPEYIAHPTSKREAYFKAYDKALAHWKVAYEELYVPTSKGTAHVVVSGPKDGEPVVLLNGMSASSTMWYPNAKALSEVYRLFAIDLIIEPGKSYKTANIKNIDGINTWYKEVFDALNLHSYHLIGTSRGGWLATNLALHYKENTKSLIVLGPVQTFMWIRPNAGLVKNLFNIFYSEDNRAVRTMETLSNDPSKINKDYIAQYRLALKNDSLNKFMGQMKPFSNRKLRSLDMPVLVLVGDNDIFNTNRTVRLAERHIPQGKGEIISDSAHFISIDQTEVVNQKILDFLESVHTEK